MESVSDAKWDEDGEGNMSDMSTVAQARGGGHGMLHTLEVVFDKSHWVIRLSSAHGLDSRTEASNG